jgi:hypothetical protein
MSTAIVECPHCKEPHKFSITHFSSDPSLPTHGDNSETAVGVVWMIIPLIVLMALGNILMFMGIPQGFLIFVVLTIIGLVWIAVYTVHITRKAK